MTSFSKKGLHAADLPPSNNGVIVCKLFGKQEMYWMSALNPGSGLETQNSLCLLRTIPRCPNKGALTELAPGTCISEGQLWKAKGTKKSELCPQRQPAPGSATFLWSTAWSHVHTEVWRCGCMVTSMHETWQLTWLSIRSPKFIRNWELLNTPVLKIDP